MRLPSDARPYQKKVKQALLVLTPAPSLVAQIQLEQRGVSPSPPSLVVSFDARHPSVLKCALKVKLSVRVKHSLNFRVYGSLIFTTVIRFSAVTLTPRNVTYVRPILIYFLFFIRTDLKYLIQGRTRSTGNGKSFLSCLPMRKVQGVDETLPTSIPVPLS